MLSIRVFQLKELLQIEMDSMFGCVGLQPFSISVIVESHFDEKSKELKSKEEIIATKEKVIQEKLDSIALLESEVASLQVRH